MKSCSVYALSISYLTSDLLIPGANFTLGVRLDQKFRSEFLVSADLWAQICMTTTDSTASVLNQYSQV